LLELLNGAYYPLHRYIKTHSLCATTSPTSPATPHTMPSTPITEAPTPLRPHSAPPLRLPRHPLRTPRHQLCPQRYTSSLNPHSAPSTPHSTPSTLPSEVSLSSLPSLRSLHSALPPSALRHPLRKQRREDLAVLDHGEEVGLSASDRSATARAPPRPRATASWSAAGWTSCGTTARTGGRGQSCCRG